MAGSVYISTNLSKAQILFLKLLDDFEIQLFRFNEIENQINQKFDNLNEVLENLVQKELLTRIERGKFCRTNFRDENVIGTFVIENSAIAYWSALNIHGLTEQFSNTIFVQTTLRKNDKEILGTSYKFVRIGQNKQLGITWNGYGNHKYPITDVEKTIVDCFDQPQYSGGYAELIRAVPQANINAEKMISYCNVMGNIALTKRIGFLVEFFELKYLKAFIDFAKEQANKRYNLIDPQGNDTGEFISDWKLRLNISKNQLKDIVNNQY